MGFLTTPTDDDRIGFWMEEYYDDDDPPGSGVDFLCEIEHGKLKLTPQKDGVLLSWSGTRDVVMRWHSYGWSEFCYYKPPLKHEWVGSDFQICILPPAEYKVEEREGGVQWLLCIQKASLR